MTERRTPGPRAQLAFRIAAVAALISAFSQVSLGGVVRVTGSGLGCPDWPLCHGRIIPPFDTATLIEYSHRLTGSALGMLVVATAVLAWIFYRSNSWVVVSSVFGVVLVIIAGGLGGLTVLTELAWWVRLIHLGVAESVVAAMAIALVAGWRPSIVSSSAASSSPAQPSPERERLTRLVLASALGVFVLILSGSYMVGYGAGTSCGTWPLCNGALFPEGSAFAIHMGHRLLAAIIGIVVLVTAYAAWTRRVERPVLGWIGLAIAALFIAQVVLGAATVWGGFPASLKAIHFSIASLIWMALAYLAALLVVGRSLPAWVRNRDRSGATGLEGATP